MTPPGPKVPIPRVPLNRYSRDADGARVAIRDEVFVAAVEGPAAAETSPTPRLTSRPAARVTTSAQTTAAHGAHHQESEPICP